MGGGLYCRLSIKPSEKLDFFAVLNTKGRAVAGLAGRAYTASQSNYCSSWMSRVRAWDGWKENGTKMAKKGVCIRKEVEEGVGG